MNRRLRARITRNAMISTRNPSPVPRTRSRRSKRSFVHVITAVVAVVAVRRRGLPRASSFISFAWRACVHVGRRGGDTRRVTTHQYHFSCLFPPQTIKKKKVQHPRSKRTGYTRVMTHHRERDTYKKSHARGPMQSRSRGKKKQNTKHPRPGVRCVCGLDDGS